MPEFLYTDAEKIKTELELGQGAEWTDDLDALLADMVEQASRLVDGVKHVPRGAYKTSDIGAAGDDTTDETRFYFGSGTPIQMIDFATSIAEIAVEETDGTFVVWTADADYYTLPYNAALLGEPIRRLEIPAKSGSTKSVWTFGPKRVRVKGKFGITVDPPADIERATMIQTQRWINRAIQGWQETGAVSELAQLRYTQQLDPDVKQLLAGAFPHVARVSV